MITAGCTHTNMLKPSANLNSDFQGTAAELAAYVAQELHRLGFSPRFYPNERLVRYYAWEQLLERPEPSLEGDRRRKLFNGRQAMRLLAARILSERGSDLESIRRRLKAAAVEKRGLDDLIDEVASVQALEGRDETEPPPLAEINEEQEFSARRMRSVENFSAMHVEPGVTEFRPLFNKAFPQRGSHSSPGSKLRRISESSSLASLSARWSCWNRHAKTSAKKPVVSTDNCWLSIRPTKASPPSANAGANYVWHPGARCSSVSMKSSVQTGLKLILSSVTSANHWKITICNKCQFMTLVSS